MECIAKNLLVWEKQQLLMSLKLTVTTTVKYTHMHTNDTCTLVPILFQQFCCLSRCSWAHYAAVATFTSELIRGCRCDTQSALFWQLLFQLLQFFSHLTFRFWKGKEGGRGREKISAKIQSAPSHTLSHHYHHDGSTVILLHKQLYVIIWVWVAIRVTIFCITSRVTTEKG